MKNIYEYVIIVLLGLILAVIIYHSPDITPSAGNVTGTVPEMVDASSSPATPTLPIPVNG